MEHPAEKEINRDNSGEYSLANTNKTNLFAAHHFFIWAYENALRTECGYKGYQPVRVSATCPLTSRRQEANVKHRIRSI